MSVFDGLDMQVRELQDRLAVANNENAQLRAELAAAKAQLDAVPWQEIFILCDIAESDGAKAAPTVVRAWLEAKAVQP